MSTIPIVLIEESLCHHKYSNMNEDHENSDFKLKSYWDERFKKEEEYDWLVKLDELKQYLVPKLPPLESNSRILIVGCGNSTFSSDLYDLGYTNIVNIDFSDVCIANMVSKNETKCPLMTWLVMDMTDMSSFENESFDVVIDKASMDALMVDEGDVWDPNDDVVDSADRMLSHISRILKSESGLFIQITFAQTHFRTKYLMGHRALRIKSSPFETLKGYSDKYYWSLDYESINPKTGCIHYFIYTMTKSLKKS